MSETPKIRQVKYRQPWPLTLPLVAFLLIGLFQPQLSRPDFDHHDAAAATDVAKAEAANANAANANAANGDAESGDEESGDGIDAADRITGDAADDLVAWTEPLPVTQYLIVYTIRVVVTGGLLVIFFRVYLSHFPLRVTWWGLAVGVIGIVLWIGLTHLRIEGRIAEAFGWSPDVLSGRSMFDPWSQLTAPGLLIAFLTLRFIGLVVIVPLAEELFVRGWLVRFMEDDHWWRVPLKKISGWRVLVPSIYGVLTHPGEAIAAAAWFGLVTWMMLRTGRFWDCVVAHAVTNLLLGIYILAFAQWHLW